MTDPLLSALVARNRWLLARPEARAAGLAPPAGLRSSRAGLARPVARATGLAPRWSRSSRACLARPVAHATGLAPRWSCSSRADLAVCACGTTQSPWWLVRGSRAALVFAAHSFSDRSVPCAREFHWNSAALDSSTLVAVTVLTVPRVQREEDQVRLDCSPHPLRWPCVSDPAYFDF